ncbi:MAG: hypothetical protein COA70_02950 [Planctomycetota bacterium]|nr:MAG: hypothetical protein COA70_02950 [Planctomycetota bacterium]
MSLTQITTLLLLAAPLAAQTVGGQSQILRAIDSPKLLDGFGDSISNRGDLNGDGFDDILIGAYSTDFGNSQDVGAAYAVSGADGTLLYQWDGVNAGDNFGIAVAYAGDVNNDGVEDVIIGARWTTSPSGRSQAGSANVYSGATGLLLYQWHGQSTSDWFGSSVAGAGDVNQDGFEDVIVGAVGADSPGLPSTGSVYVYSGADGSQLYKWTGTQLSDQFGFTVAAAGDLNADGFADVVAGTSQSTPGVLGRVMVYSGVDGSVLYQFDPSTAVSGFGTSIDMLGDVNADGTIDFILGERNENSGGLFGNGSATVYSGLDGSVLYKLFGENSFDGFGASVSRAGDINQDGYDDFLINADAINLGGLSDTGAVYLYSGADGTLMHRFDGQFQGSFFGRSISGGGDVNADGLPDLLIWQPQPTIMIADVVTVFSFHPFLAADAPTLSAATGGTLNFTLDFPGSAAFYDYKVILSGAGNGPTFFGVNIPLTLDGLVVDSFLGNYPAPNTNMHGTLDSAGNASASLTAPANLPPAMIGKTFHLAAIANPSGQLPEYSSVAVSVTVLP